MIYTVVDEGYDVIVYRTAGAVAKSLGDTGLCLESADDSDGDPLEASAADILKAIRKESVVRLFPVEGGDWKCRIEKHDKALS